MNILPQKMTTHSTIFDDGGDEDEEEEDNSDEFFNDFPNDKNFILFQQQQQQRLLMQQQLNPQNNMQPKQEYMTHFNEYSENPPKYEDHQFHKYLHQQKNFQQTLNQAKLQHPRKVYLQQKQLPRYERTPNQNYKLQRFFNQPNKAFDKKVFASQKKQENQESFYQRSVKQQLIDYELKRQLLYSQHHNTSHHPPTYPPREANNILSQSMLQRLEQQGYSSFANQQPYEVNNSKVTNLSVKDSITTDSLNNNLSEVNQSCSSFNDNFKNPALNTLKENGREVSVSKPYSLPTSPCLNKRLLLQIKHQHQQLHRKQLLINQEPRSIINHKVKNPPTHQDCHKTQTTNEEISLSNHANDRIQNDSENPPHPHSPISSCKQPKTHIEDNTAIKTFSLHINQGNTDRDSKIVRPSNINIAKSIEKSLINTTKKHETSVSTKPQSIALVSKAKPQITTSTSSLAKSSVASSLPTTFVTTTTTTKSTTNLSTKTSTTSTPTTKRKGSNKLSNITIPPGSIIGQLLQSASHNTQFKHENIKEKLIEKGKVAEKKEKEQETKKLATKKISKITKTTESQKQKPQTQQKPQTRSFKNTFGFLKAGKHFYKNKLAVTENIVTSETIVINTPASAKDNIETKVFQDSANNYDSLQDTSDNTTLQDIKNNNMNIGDKDNGKLGPYQHKEVVKNDNKGDNENMPNSKITFTNQTLTLTTQQTSTKQLKELPKNDALKNIASKEQKTPLTSETATTAVSSYIGSTDTNTHQDYVSNIKLTNPHSKPKTQYLNTPSSTLKSLDQNLKVGGALNSQIMYSTPKICSRGQPLIHNRDANKRSSEDIFLTDTTSSLTTKTSLTTFAPKNTDSIKKTGTPVQKNASRKPSASAKQTNIVVKPDNFANQINNKSYMQNEPSKSTPKQKRPHTGKMNNEKISLDLSMQQNLTPIQTRQQLPFSKPHYTATPKSQNSNNTSSHEAINANMNPQCLNKLKTGDNDLHEKIIVDYIKEHSYEEKNNESFEKDSTFLDKNTQENNFNSNNNQLLQNTFDQNQRLIANIMMNKINPTNIKNNNIARTRGFNDSPPRTYNPYEGRSQTAGIISDVNNNNILMQPSIESLSTIKFDNIFNDNGWFGRSACHGSNIIDDANGFLESIVMENKYLKNQLENYHGKASCVEKLEEEIDKMGFAYSSILAKAEEKENIDKLKRMNLECEVQRLTQDNCYFKGQLQECLNRLNTLNNSVASMNSSMQSCDTPCQPRQLMNVQKKEAQKRDVVLMDLIEQNHLLVQAKAELELETAFLKKKLNEQQKELDTLKNVIKQSTSYNADMFLASNQEMNHTLHNMQAQTLSQSYPAVFNEQQKNLQKQLHLEKIQQQKELQSHIDIQRKLVHDRLEQLQKPLAPTSAPGGIIDSYKHHANLLKSKLKQGPNQPNNSTAATQVLRQPVITQQQLMVKQHLQQRMQNFLSNPPKPHTIDGPLTCMQQQEQFFIQQRLKQQQELNNDRRIKNNKPTILQPIHLPDTSSQSQVSHEPSLQSIKTFTNPKVDCVNRKPKICAKQLQKQFEQFLNNFSDSNSSLNNNISSDVTFNDNNNNNIRHTREKNLSMIILNDVDDDEDANEENPSEYYRPQLRSERDEGISSGQASYNHTTGNTPIWKKEHSFFDGFDYLVDSDDDEKEKLNDEDYNDDIAEIEENDMCAEKNG